MTIIGSTKKKLLEAIGKEPSHGYELSERVGISKSSAYDHLADLCEDGFIKFEKRGRRKVYELTSKGGKLLEALE
ncbi:hypothetical protein AKJ65_08135 [candidate division MSBL1 archaeon SCGC-AAA259E19]|uniref:HTH arsR-type domain-containing protein n=1 Tax=candidate division MSBL1 archaeon SCGC-AAA259E19 TaxID=1698264 RepID=A0A133UCX2_9EURY|nr:hypothetical protein AKJ65_08135 [candidate division MSBL1 archaeon SCGC-AAA259E19]